MHIRSARHALGLVSSGLLLLLLCSALRAQPEPRPIGRATQEDTAGQPEKSAQDRARRQERHERLRQDIDRFDPAQREAFEQRRAERRAQWQRMSPQERDQLRHDLEKMHSRHRHPPNVEPPRPAPTEAPR